MLNIRTMFTLLALLAPLGCDDGVTDDADAVALEGAGDLESEDADPAERPALRFSVNGEPAPERLIATVEADPNTTLYFIKGSPDADGRFGVDVAMLGRGPGPDYSALLADNQATPLELYIAVSGDERPVPADLELAHAWEVERSRPGDTAPRRLAAPTPDPESAYGPSGYTCLSWANFQQYMSTRFPTDSGRDLTVASSASTSPDNMWTVPYQYDSKADVIACNYKTPNADPDYDDLIIADVCYWDGPGPADIEEGCLQGYLWNGWYVREIYSRSAGTRYYVNVIPVGTTPLTSFMGVLKANP